MCHQTKDPFEELCSPGYQAKLKEECASARYRAVQSLHDRFLSDGFWSDRSISGLNEHAQLYGYDLWITPSNRDGRYALRIHPNMINGMPQGLGL